jgi:hypothetical protein
VDENQCLGQMVVRDQMFDFPPHCFRVVEADDHGKRVSGQCGDRFLPVRMIDVSPGHAIGRNLVAGIAERDDRPV